MKKSIFAGLATIVLALFTVTPAAAESYLVDNECVPADATYAIEYEYVKQVKGKIQVDLDPTPGRWWVNTGETFGWEVWSGGSTQWSEQVVDVLEQGAHSATQATWSEHGITYRKVTTHYRYVPTGETKPGRELTPAVTCSEPGDDPEPGDDETGDDEKPQPETQPEPAAPAVPELAQPTFTG